MAPVSSSSSATIVESVLTFIKGGNLLRASKPGFAHALKLSYNTIAKERLSVGPTTLTYRYRLDQDVPRASLGLLTALMDELSTDACFRVGQPSAPGVSLQMQTELLVRDLPETKEIDIINTVTKLGRTISHTRTNFLCASSQTVLAHSSHVKYMPTGSLFIDWLFNNKLAFNLYSKLVLPRLGEPLLYEEKPLVKDVLHSHLEFQGLGRATFHITREHTNGFGSMHGGCQAMVMEQVAEAYAKAELHCDTAVILEAIQIDYLGAAKGTIDIVCETLGKSADSTIHVRVLLTRGDRILSDGKLRFTTSTTTKA
jgi:acyl-coenzyme A thioesterase PaaI-like protein